MLIGSLFSGIGGLELGLERSGVGTVAFQVEIDPFCRKVLEKNWPSVARFSDVKDVGPHNLPWVDVMCGGPPCQDLSSAGEKMGLSGPKSGLAYEYIRIIKSCRPRVLVWENVASGSGRWLCQVRTMLHELGYNTSALALSAQDVGAPHGRERVFLVGFVANTDGEWQRGKAIDEVAWREITCRNRTGNGSGNGRSPRTTECGLVRSPDGLSSWMDEHKWPSGRHEEQCSGEPSRTIAPRTDPHRTMRLKALGNAVVPQCAYVVGKWMRSSGIVP